MYVPLSVYIHIYICTQTRTDIDIDVDMGGAAWIARAFGHSCYQDLSKTAVEAFLEATPPADSGFADLMEAICASARSTRGPKTHMSPKESEYGL